MGTLPTLPRLVGVRGKAICLRAHVQVAKAFIPNPLNLPFVNHVDVDKTNNWVSNLEWVTNQENIDHAQALGLYVGKRGWTSTRSKLTAEQVEVIKTKIGVVGLRKLAKEYKVNKETIRRVGKEMTYRIAC